jgi:feruloyl esterase
MDGMIWNPEVVKLERADYPFLSDDQYGTLEMLRNGVNVGPVSYPGYWFSNPASLSRTVIGATPPPWGPGQGPALFTVTATGAQGERGPTFNALKDIDYTSPADMAKEAAQATKAPRSIDFDPSHMAALKASGAKVIMWTGAADNAVPPETIVQYTNGMTQVFGPTRTTFFRSFFAPGMYHCTGGVGQPTDFQGKLLEAAQDWVEKGIAPDYVVATNTPREESGGNGVPSFGAFTGKPTRTYLICSYPAKSVFKGGVNNPDKLDVNDAKNWRCEG